MNWLMSNAADRVKVSVVVHEQDIVPFSTGGNQQIGNLYATPDICPSTLKEVTYLECSLIIEAVHPEPGNTMEIVANGRIQTGISGASEYLQHDLVADSNLALD